MTFSGVGEVTCSLGEIVNRGDLIIFWGPIRRKPSAALQRVQLDAQGNVFARRAARTAPACWSTCARPRSAKAADIFLQIKPRKDFEALWMLRALARDGARRRRGRGRNRRAAVGLARSDGADEAARFGVIAVRHGADDDAGKHLNTEALLALVRDMNAYTRFVAKPMRGHGNVTGADNVVCVADGLSVRRQFVAQAIRGSILASTPRPTHSARRGRRGADRGQRPMSNFSQPARPPGRDSLRGARPRGDADDAGRRGGLYHGHLRHQHAGHGLSRWTTCRFRCGPVRFAASERLRRSFRNWSGEFASSLPAGRAASARAERRGAQAARRRPRACRSWGLMLAEPAETISRRQPVTASSCSRTGSARSRKSTAAL